MDEKKLDQNEDLDLDSILDEFQSPAAAGSPEEDAADLGALLEDLGPQFADSQEENPEEGQPLPTEADVEEVFSQEELSQDEASEAEMPQDAEAGEEESASLEEAPLEAAEASEEEVIDPLQGTQDDLDLSDLDLGDYEPSDSEAPEAEAASEEAAGEAPAEEAQASDGQEEAPAAPRIYYDPQARLRELKHKLVAGPEKQYYALSELGVGKLQLAVLINVILVVLCAVGAVFFAAGRVPENRMRFMIFSQVLAMLISGLLGLNHMIDGFNELFKGKFNMATLLALTFLACIADAFFSLRDLRVPCCCAFCLEMCFALSARCQVRSTEMGQMDTLRKAVRLHSLKKVPDYYNNQAGFLRTDGELEDFTDNYQKSSGPQKLQNFYAFFSFLICLGIAVLAGVLHGPSMAVQILATSLLVAVPASFFIALTRPAAILERRLHMVGTVLCGWNGVKGLSGKGIFPIRETDLFPQGSTKLNGIKFYSDRDPDMIVSYTSSLILQAESNLIPIFEQLMNSRGVVANPVYNFQIYEEGGIGGDVCGESVLLGSNEFLQSRGVNIPEGSMVSQAVYAAIDGQLAAVIAVSFAKMRSAAAGMVTLCGYRKLTPVFVGGDFLLTESFVRGKFEIKTRRLLFPDDQQKAQLNSKQIPEELPGLALSTRPDLISFAYAVTGARSLRTSCKWGMALHMLGGILGMLSMLVLAITGSTELLTPVNILLYQLTWLVPGFLFTEWVRHV